MGRRVFFVCVSDMLFAEKKLKLVLSLQTPYAGNIPIFGHFNSQYVPNYDVILSKRCRTIRNQKQCLNLSYDTGGNAEALIGRLSHKDQFSHFFFFFFQENGLKNYFPSGKGWGRCFLDGHRSKWGAVVFLNTLGLNTTINCNWILDYLQAGPREFELVVAHSLC